MLIPVNVNNIDSVDVLRFLCVELDGSLGSLREEVFELENTLGAYTNCLYEIAQVLHTFDPSSDDSSFAIDVVNSIRNIVFNFNIV